MKTLSQAVEFSATITEAHLNNFGSFWYARFYDADGDVIFDLRFQDKAQAEAAIAAINHNATIFVNL